MVPLSFMFGFGQMQEFLAGCREMDKTFVSEKDPLKNLPLLQGLLGFYQATVQEYGTLAVIPYSQPLNRFVAHIQQLMMESNGKYVNSKGQPLPYATEPVIYG
jgi:glucose-6-phosphate isomerase